MKIRAAFCIAVTVITTLACGGATTDTPKTTEPVTTEPVASTSTLPEPWGSMNLPVGVGEVLTADNTMLLVTYETASLTSLSTDWSNAVMAAGYVQAEDVSTPGLTAIIYKKDTKLVGLATGQEEGVNFAYMEDLGVVADSAIRSGRRPGVAARRGGGSGTGGGSTTGGKGGKGKRNQ
jgi:hypothetical protein